MFCYHFFHINYYFLPTKPCPPDINTLLVVVSEPIYLFIFIFNFFFFKKIIIIALMYNLCIRLSFIYLSQSKKSFFIFKYFKNDRKIIYKVIIKV